MIVRTMLDTPSLFLCSVALQTINIALTYNNSYRRILGNIFLQYI